MAQAEPSKRKYITFDPVLFPHGITPGNIVELRGIPGSGKTFLMTYLMARFLLKYPEKRAIFIDTRHHFSLPAFLRILWGLNQSLYDHQLSMEELQTNEKLGAIIERLTIIPCYGPEHLLLCLGPKENGQLQQMLEAQPDFSIIFIDSLDSYSYISSVTASTPEEFLDFGKLLKRSVESTDTPVIYSSLSIYGRPKKPGEEEEDEDSSGGKQDKLLTNIVLDPIYSHRVQLESVPVTMSQYRQYRCKFIARAYLRSRNRPSMPLSGVSHFVKFSISSGILMWLSI